MLRSYIYLERHLSHGTFLHLSSTKFMSHVTFLDFSREEFMSHVMFLHFNREKFMSPREFWRDIHESCYILIFF